ncbi:hypothetical protein XELAEV_18026620mg [Xenopus laevis]|uniref:Uncharacterized protein n=1 Tax=Xenopus laevis TaxID=8355 RepID=A0A974CU23_XENLA|nr:hypothetical protein XELAEV_18026620mg [Xenopus laevis]
MGNRGTILCVCHWAMPHPEFLTCPHCLLCDQFIQTRVSVLCAYISSFHTPYLFSPLSLQCRIQKDEETPPPYLTTISF